MCSSPYPNQCNNRAISIIRFENIIDENFDEEGFYIEANYFSREKIYLIDFIYDIHRIFLYVP